MPHSTLLSFERLLIRPLAQYPRQSRLVYDDGHDYVPLRLRLALVGCRPDLKFHGYRFPGVRGVGRGLPLCVLPFLSTSCATGPDPLLLPTPYRHRYPRP